MPPILEIDLGTRPSKVLKEALFCILSIVFPAESFLRNCYISNIEINKNRKLHRNRENVFYQSFISGGYATQRILFEKCNILFSSSLNLSNYYDIQGLRNQNQNSLYCFFIHFLILEWEFNNFLNK